MVGDSNSGAYRPDPVSVRPVIFLPVERLTFPPDSKATALANEIDALAPAMHYIKTYGGWYVPLYDLRDHMAALAELLYHHIVYTAQMEIGGGLDVRNEAGESLGISERSTIRLAMGLARALLNPPEEEQRIFASPTDVWRVSASNGVVRIQSPVREMAVPSGDLQIAIKAAILQVQEFAARLEPLLLSYQDQWITTGAIQSVFGLRK